MKIIVFFIQASEIKSILEHLGIMTEVPKMRQARGQSQCHLWSWPIETKEHLNYIDVADQD
jgi:hypothetical protein